MSYNTRSPAVKRLLTEAKELHEPTELFYTQPTDDNIFEWHFTIRGPPDTDFSGGVYHGRIILPAEYPMKPPSIVFLTHNGRFKVNEKICLSISGHHPETWQPSWSIRTALLALIGFMPTNGEGALGSLDYTPEERKKLAKQSLLFKCPNCDIENEKILLNLTEKSDKICEEAKELASQIDFKNSKPANNSTPSTSGPESNLRQRTTSNSDENVNLTSSINDNSNETNSSAISANTSSSGLSPYSAILLILCLLFVFLFLRRLLIIFEGF